MIPHNNRKEEEEEFTRLLHQVTIVSTAFAIIVTLTIIATGLYCLI